MKNILSTILLLVSVSVFAATTTSPRPIFTTGTGSGGSSIVTTNGATYNFNSTRFTVTTGTNVDLNTVDGSYITANTVTSNKLISVDFGQIVGFLNTPGTLFVDPTNGNDSTAIKGIQDKAWKTIGAANSNAVSGDVIMCSPGYFVVTQTLVLQPRVNLIFPAGPQCNTVLWTGASVTGVETNWVCINPTTNNWIYGANIVGASNGLAVFQAAVGSMRDTVITNLNLENCVFNCDSDNILTKPGTLSAPLVSGSAHRCSFNAKWDTGTDNYGVFYYYDCTFLIKGPFGNSAAIGRGIYARTGSVYCYNCSFSVIGVEGGTFVADLGVAGASPHPANLTMYNCSWTTGNANFDFEFLGAAGGNLTLVNCLQASAGRVTTQQSAVPPPLDTSLGQADVRFGNVMIVGGLPTSGSRYIWTTNAASGILYYNTNTTYPGLEMSDGFNWRNVAGYIITNKWIVTGASATYNGIYTLKSLTVDGNPGITATNFLGKFLLHEDQNAFGTDASWGISDNATLVDSAETYTSAAGFDKGWINGADGLLVNSVSVAYVAAPTTISSMDIQTRTNLISPATGSVIFQSDSTPGLYAYNGTVWTNVSSAINGVAAGTGVTVVTNGTLVTVSAGSVNSGTFYTTNYQNGVWLTNQYSTPITLSGSVYVEYDVGVLGEIDIQVPGSITNKIWNSANGGTQSMAVMYTVTVPPGKGFCFTNTSYANGPGVYAYTTNGTQVFIH